MPVHRILALFGALALSASATASDSMTLRKIRETGVISLGYRGSSIPFSYLDEHHRPVGYSMDLCLRIVAAVKEQLRLPDLQVKLTPVTSATRLPMVVNQTIDLECGTTTNNATRQQQVAFGVTTFVAASRLATRRSLPVRSLDDLRGRTVVSTAGTTSMALLLELNTSRALNMTIVTGKDHAQSFRMLETGRADAFAMDDVLLAGLIASSAKPAEFVVNPMQLSVEPYGIVVRKGDGEFKRVVDDTLVSLFRSGEIGRIYQKWFLSPIPPQQINLQLPMSPSLRRLHESPTDTPDPLAYQ